MTNRLEIAQELKTITQMIWTPLVGNVNESEYNVSHDALIVTYGASVHLLGSWLGSVSIEISKDLATTVSEKMLHIEKSEITDDDRFSVLKELANMTGGNIKGLLGDKCILSTPSVFKNEGSPFSLPETSEIIKLCFSCDEEILVVRVHKSFLNIHDMLNNEE